MLHAPRRSLEHSGWRRRLEIVFQSLPSFSTRARVSRWRGALPSPAVERKLEILSRPLHPRNKEENSTPRRLRFRFAPSCAREKKKGEKKNRNCAATLFTLSLFSPSHALSRFPLLDPPNENTPPPQTGQQPESFAQGGGAAGEGGAASAQGAGGAQQHGGGQGGGGFSGQPQGYGPPGGYAPYGGPPAPYGGPGGGGGGFGSSGGGGGSYGPPGGEQLTFFFFALSFFSCLGNEREA